MTVFGYARVSTADQRFIGQIEALKAAGATTIYREKISGLRQGNKDEVAVGEMTSAEIELFSSYCLHEDRVRAVGDYAARASKPERLCFPHNCHELSLHAARSDCRQFSQAFRRCSTFTPARGRLLGDCMSWTEPFVRANGASAAGSTRAKFISTGARLASDG
jgi:hypothetical protein